MCRLLAFSFKATTDTSEKINYLNAFRALAATGKVVSVSGPGHKDGWGIAVYGKDKEEPVVYKSLESADADAVFFPEQFFKAACAQSGLAHLRKKTVGDLSMENTHPFVSQGYAFIHNGTVEKGEGPYLELTSVCKGLTDSERLFQKFLQIKGSDGSKSTLDAYLEMLATTKESYPNFSALNSILCDGKFLYISRIMNTDFPGFEELDLENYYTLFIGKTPAGDSVVCSEKLLYPGMSYRLMDNNSICMIELATGEEETLLLYPAVEESVPLGA